MVRTVKQLQVAAIVICLGFVGLAAQDLPQPPADHSLIYALDEKHNTIALPFETATTPLKIEQVAKSTSSSYVELKGEHASTVLPANTLIFVFAVDRGGAHPPLIVWLTPHRGSRRATAIAERGRTGFGIEASQIVRPIPRGLSKNGDEVFMELRPRTSLMPGEYAIIGNDLTRVATFRVVSAGN
jgi:hypothetical protein